MRHAQVTADTTEPVVIYNPAHLSQNSALRWESLCRLLAASRMRRTCVPWPCRPAARMALAPTMSTCCSASSSLEPACSAPELSRGCTVTAKHTGSSSIIQHWRKAREVVTVPHRLRKKEGAPRKSKHIAPTLPCPTHCRLCALPPMNVAFAASASGL